MMSNPIRLACVFPLLIVGVGGCFPGPKGGVVDADADGLTSGEDTSATEVSTGVDTGEGEDTAISCTADCGSLTTDCAEGICDGATGRCTTVALADDSGCDDGDLCTVGDRCLQGACVGVANDCDDARACSVDGCSAATGACVHDTASCACDGDEACDDGRLCTVDTCDTDAGACVIDDTACECVTDSGCDDGEACTTDVCTAEGSCESSALVDGAPCAEGICLAGACSDAMVVVPAGGFRMGCDESTTCPVNARPEHLVATAGYLIDRVEVTALAYAVCADEDACTPGSTVAIGTTHGSALFADHPANHLSWTEAAAYCEFAGKRLCTESEWEKAAAGAGSGYLHPWGDAPAADCALAVIDDGAPGCGTGTTAPVGSRPAGASPYGALDMIGNVSEWVSDCYASDLANHPTDGSAYASTSCSNRVTRGGAYGTPSFDAHRYQRAALAAYQRLASTGFRCCRDL